MGTHVIPESQWLSYLNDLSVLKRRARVRVALLAAGNQEKLLADGLPLLGMTPELRGSQKCAVDVEVGDQRGEGDRLTHSVICTAVVAVEEDEAGEARAVELRGEDPQTHEKVTTVIRFL